MAGTILYTPGSKLTLPEDGATQGLKMSILKETSEPILTIQALRIDDPP